MTADKPCCRAAQARALRALARWLRKGFPSIVYVGSIQVGYKIAAAEALARSRRIEARGKKGAKRGK